MIRMRRATKQPLPMHLTMRTFVRRSRILCGSHVVMGTWSGTVIACMDSLGSRLQRL